MCLPQDFAGAHCHLEGVWCLEPVPILRKLPEPRLCSLTLTVYDMAHAQCFQRVVLGLNKAQDRKGEGKEKEQTSRHLVLHGLVYQINKKFSRALKKTVLLTWGFVSNANSRCCGFYKERLSRQKG